MATPTAKPTPVRPSGPFTPSASGNAASPSQTHLANKNLTRSPAAVRTRAGTLSRMEHSTSQQGATPGSTTLRGGSSPAPYMMGTPSMSQGQGGIGLGIGGTPGSVGMARAGSTGLGLGLGASGIGMPSDKELNAKAKIREITEMLKHEWGYVSREGFVAAAQRLKLEVLWETAETDNPAIVDIAGEHFMIIAHFWNWSVTKLTLELAFADKGGTVLAEKDDNERGSHILLRDLQGWNDERQSGGYVKLRRFCENLEYIGSIDNWSKMGVNCFVAIDGICRSLKQIERWWKQQPDLPGSGDRFEMLVSGPGRPQMHANGQVGLIWDYWLQRWESKRDVKPASYLTSPTDIERQLYSMRISVAMTDPGSTVKPIRISTEWFEILKESPKEDTAAANLPSDFLPSKLRVRDVDITYVPVAEEPGASRMEVDGNAPPRPLPQVLFKARFEPSLPIGYHVMQNLLTGRHGMMLQAQLPIMASYLQMVLPEHSGPEENFAATTTPLLVNATLGHPETKEDVPLCYSLSGLQDASTLSSTMIDFPFSHPSELLSLLPTFRMWAFLDGLFKRSFGAAAKGRSQQSEKLRTANGGNGSGLAGGPITQKSKKKKLRLRDLSAKEYRALVKAGKPLPPNTHSDDEDAEEKSQAASKAEQKMIEIAVDFPMEDLQSVYLDITVPVGEDEDPVVAFLAVQPGPKIVTRDSSVGEKWAEKMTYVLLTSEDFGMTALWVWENKKRLAKLKKEASV